MPIAPPEASAQSMPASLSTNGLVCSLEMFVGVVERVMAQEQQLQNVTKDIASIKAEVVEINMRLPSVVNAAEREITNEKSVKLGEGQWTQQAHGAVDLDTLWSEQNQLSNRLSVLQQRVEHIETSLLLPASSHDAVEGNMVTSSGYIPESQLLALDEKCTTLSLESSKLREMCEENTSRIGSLENSSNTGPDIHKLMHSATLSLQAEYEWQQSMWEASVFLGTGESWGETVALGACLLVNVGMSLWFILHCAYSLTDTMFGEHSQRQFYQWQTSVAHDITFRNPFTDESLASTVCRQKLYSPFATLQFQLVGQLQQYLDPFLGARAGLSLCLLSLAVWFLTLICEIRLMVLKSRALRSLPWKSRTEFEIEPGGQSMNLISLSKRRLVVVLVIYILRFSVWISLAVVGTLWLVHEISLESMILNSVSLQVVLDLDELIYAALLPTTIQMRMRALSPVKYAKADETLANTFFNVLGSFVVLGGSLALVYVFILDPFVHTLGENHDALCGPDRSYDFVVAIDALGIPWVAQTPNMGETESFASGAVKKAIRDGGLKEGHLTSAQRSNAGTFMQVYSGFELEKRVELMPEFTYPAAWALINPMAGIPEIRGWDESKVLIGKDFGDAPNTVYNAYLQYRLGVSGNVTCADVPEHLCYTVGSTAEELVIRKLCQVRCGCDLPNAGTVSTSLSDSQSGFAGCAAWNMNRDVFINELDRLSCLDTKNSDSFASWVKGIGDARLNDKVTNAWANGGCPEVVAVNIGGGQGSVMNLCAQTTLPSICPESCGCNITIPWTKFHTKVNNFCPYSCGRTERPCVTVFKDWGDTDTGPDGPLPGVACMFPFRYKGTVYRNCTTEDWKGPWCGVTLANNGYSSKLWGDCPDTRECLVGR